jgi:mannose-6-phosphate isomerase-like protein (cupin superfamily)
MDDFFWISHSASSECSTGPWLYRRSATQEIVELAMVHGSAVALPTHFHDEDQITFVLSGQRRFRIDGGLIELRPGQGAFITAGTPHSSLAEPEGVVCFNAYLSAGVSALSRLVEDMRAIGTGMGAFLCWTLREWSVRTGKARRMTSARPARSCHSARMARLVTRRNAPA